MIIAQTSFTEAEKEFKNFLADNNLPSDILWVFREDTISRNRELYERQFWLKPPSPEENRKIAEKYYEIGQQRSLGICLSAFAICGDKIGCCIILPKDKEDSEYLLMSSTHLKLSFTIDMPTAQIIKSYFSRQFFKMLRFKYKQGCYVDYLPSKYLQFSSV